MPTYLSQITYTSTGVNTYAIPFTFISKEHIKVFVDGTEKTQDTDFTVNSQNNIDFSVGTAPSNGATILIKRETPNNSRLVDFVDGSVLTEADLDKSANQNFFIAQEITDDQENNLKIDTDDKYDANSKVIKNLANPTNNQDAVTKNYLENTFLTTANKTALTTINDNIANINAVNSNETNINAVQSNEANINTVSSNISSVNTVATNINDVIAVANDLSEAVSEVETVANDLNEATSEIEVVANNIANVNAVGTDIANVNSVASIGSTTLNTVAGINATHLANVSAVDSEIALLGTTATKDAIVRVGTVDAIADINQVQTKLSEIETCADNITNINTVSGISTSDLSTVATNATSVGTVASNITAINNVNTNISDIQTANTNSANINVVASDITNVNSIASNITAINNVNTNISDIQTANSNSASISTVASNISGVNSFADRYRVSAGDPSTNNDEGDLAYNTQTRSMRYYNGTEWEDAIGAGSTDPEVYGFFRNSNHEFVIQYTDGGNDNISASDYANFADVLFSPSGYGFSVNTNGELIITI